MTFKKLASVLLMTAIFFGATSAWAIDYKTSIALALGSNGNIAGEAYTLKVPETLKVSKKGWNPMDDIHVVKDGEDFSKEKKLVVTASSTNNFALKSGENSISYTLTTAENGAQTTVWEFSAAEINAEGGTGKGIGITVTWDETQAAGKYEDEITYTVEVQYATLSLTNGDNVSMTFSAGGNSYSIRGSFNGSGFTITSASQNGLNMEWYTNEGGHEFIRVVNGSDYIVTFNLTNCTYSPYQENTTLTSITIGGTDVTSSFSLPNSEAEK